MKCKICGHRSNTIAAMAKHYRQKHPRRMARRKVKKKVGKRKYNVKGYTKSGVSLSYIKESKPFTTKQREKIEEWIDEALERAERG